MAVAVQSPAAERRSPARESGRDPARGGGGARALLAALLGFFVISLDALVVTVALPAVRGELGGGMSGAQWVVDGYTLLFAALMLSAGALSDRIGARRAFASGLAVFAAASAACGLAPSLAVLVGARMVQGAAAAVLLPASLALVRQAFPDAGRRARAIALWTAGGALAAAAGPLVGGVLTDTLGWRWIFFVNLPVAAVALALTARAASSPRRPARLDLPGQALAVLAMAALTFGVIDGGGHGFGTLRAAGSLVLAAAAGAGFLLRQARAAEPMIPLGVFRSRTVAACLVAGFAANAVFYGAVFLMSLYFQQQRGESALTTGLLFLPMMALIAVVNLGSARVAARFGPRVPVAVGQGVLLVGALVLCAALGGGADLPLWAVALLMVPTGLGGAFAMPSLTALMLDAVPAERAGAAGAVHNTVRQVGNALSVAVFGVLLAGGSFTSGLRASLALAAVAMAASLAASVTLLRRR